MIWFRYVSKICAMARRKRAMHLVLGVLVGVIIGHLIKNNDNIPTPETSTDAQKIIGFNVSTRSDKNLVFVGVMSAAKYLETRAKAVYDTWGVEIPGNIVFFSSEVSRSSSIPLVSLPDVDDAYPPQKKSFMMLKYMYDNFGDSFEWFVRADDDVYIRAERLELFLRSIDSKKPQFIGQAGRGTLEEFGLLSLEYDENFCMGGPGVILSKETLKRIAPHITYCLQNLYTAHEDVELGRCVRKFAGISCTWSYDMQSILYHNQSGEQAFTSSLKQHEVHQAITLHPVKNPGHMYRLHNYFRSLKIQALKQENIYLLREISKSMSSLGRTQYIADEVPLLPPKKSLNHLNDIFTVGVTPGLNRYKPDTSKNMLVWDFMTKSIYSTADSNPRHKLNSALKEGLADVIREVMESINVYSKQRGRVIDFKEFIYGYRRIDPLHGVDWILDLLLVYKKYRGHKMTVPVRRHAYVQQTFTGVEVHEIKQKQEKINAVISSEQEFSHKIHKVLHQSIQHIKSLNILPSFSGNKYTYSDPLFHKKIYFILPLSGRIHTFRRFLSYYEDICIKNEENVALVIVLYKNFEVPDEFSETLTMISDLKKQYYSDTLDIKVIQVVSKPFSRGNALQIGASNCVDTDLLFFIDVDMVFTSQTLLNIRINTIKNKQVYFPIVFSEYNPNFVNNNFNYTNINTLLKSNDHNRNPFVFTDLTGYWRQFGFGIASIFKCDLVKVGGFNTTIQGWGLEDISLIDNFLKSDLKVFRAPEPSLVHIFHPIECKNNLGTVQMKMCIGSQANTIGSSKQLHKYIVNNPTMLNYLKQFSKPDS